MTRAARLFKVNKALQPKLWREFRHKMAKKKDALGWNLRLKHSERKLQNGRPRQ